MSWKLKVYDKIREKHIDWNRRQCLWLNWQKSEKRDLHSQTSTADKEKQIKLKRTSLDVCAIRWKWCSVMKNKSTWKKKKSSLVKAIMLELLSGNVQLKYENTIASRKQVHLPSHSKYKFTFHLKDQSSPQQSIYIHILIVERMIAFPSDTFAH